MIETSNSIYADIARLKFPTVSHIDGAGRYAILSRCPERPFIRLYETAIEAQPLLREPCGHAFCKGAHVAVDLDKRPAQVPYRKRAHWHRLIELPR